MSKKTPKSRIFEVVRETAQDLHVLGFFDKRYMQKYDALCIAPIPDCNPDVAKNGQSTP